MEYWVLHRCWLGFAKLAKMQKRRGSIQGWRLHIHQLAKSKGNRESVCGSGQDRKIKLKWTCRWLWWSRFIAFWEADREQSKRRTRAMNSKGPNFAAPRCAVRFWRIQEHHSEELEYNSGHLQTRGWCKNLHEWSGDQSALRVSWRSNEHGLLH